MRGVSITIGSVIAVVIVLAVVMIGLPTYNVYSKQMQGKAAYEQAVQDRRIRVLEAQAALDSAQLTAQAEVARARGTNEANPVMAESLGGPGLAPPDGVGTDRLQGLGVHTSGCR